MLHHWHLIFSHDCMVPRGTLSGNHLFIKACQLDTLWWQCAELNMFLLYKSYLLPRAVENWKKGVVVISSAISMITQNFQFVKHMIILCMFWIYSFLMPVILLVDFFFIFKSTWFYFARKLSKINWSWVSVVNLYRNILQEKNCNVIRHLGIFIIGKPWSVWSICVILWN